MQCTTVDTSHTFCIRSYKQFQITAVYIGHICTVFVQQLCNTILFGSTEGGIHPLHAGGCGNGSSGLLSRVILFPEYLSN